MGCETERVAEFLPWARHFARACASKLPSPLYHDDLQSAGILGYLRAAARYDVSRGASFRGYCAVRIRGAILDELRRWEWAPRSVHKNRRRITRVTSNLTEQLEREPTEMELATALGINQSDLSAFQTHATPRQVISFDEVTDNGNGDENLTLTERLADPFASRPDAAVLSLEDRRALRRCLERLPKMQITVIVQHYLHNVPLRDVAKKLAVTPSRVSQLHHQALARLKQGLHRSHSPAG
jgi:RNA polymerase sigma factor for flagellar operon FliA